MDLCTTTEISDRAIDPVVVRMQIFHKVYGILMYIESSMPNYVGFVPHSKKLWRSRGRAIRERAHRRRENRNPSSNSHAKTPGTRNASARAQNLEHRILRNARKNSLR